MSLPRFVLGYAMFAVLSFIITISILVIIHEFGHYLFARLFKVQVLTFSIGFGPKLFGWRTKHNYWRVGAIPLGGYVRMLDEREQNVPPEYQHLCYNQKPPLQKLLIAFAGPLFNLLFAFLAYYALGIFGVSELKPIISVSSPSPYLYQQTTISNGAMITAINDQPVYSWNEADASFKRALSTNPQVQVTLKEAGQERKLAFNLTSMQMNDANPSLIDLGWHPVNYLPQISYIEPGSPAQAAGLKSGDTIVQINNESIHSWFQVAKTIRNSPSMKLNLVIKRQQQTLHRVVTTVSTTDDNGQIIGKVGIMPTLDAQNLVQNSYIKYYTPLTSLAYATNACLNLVASQLKILSMMLNGQMSWHNLGGPVTIANASQSALHQGVKAFVDLLALISLSLAVMNLLPIPVLDGGHILIYAAELISGKRIPEKAQQYLFKVGLLIVLSLTFIAIYNDILKLLNI